MVRIDYNSAKMCQIGEEFMLLDNTGLEFNREYASKTVVALADTILKMIKETDGEKYEDVRAPIQKLTFVEAAKEFKIRRVLFSFDQQKALGLVNSDGIYTNLGLLLSDQCAHTVKLAVFEGTTKVVFNDRRKFEGSLLKQLNGAFEFIDRYNRNRSEIKGLHRIDKRDYPVEAVREALLNAFVHRDYSYSDSTIISIFDDRIELISIGGLARGIAFEEMMLGISVARNRSLANLFYCLSLIEAYGVGIPKIIQSYKGYTVKPQIEVTNNIFKITLPNTNEVSKRVFLSENECAVMALYDLKDKEFIVRKDIETALSVSQTMAVRLLKGLLDKNEIRAIGNGKNTKYISNKNIH
jgi:ATP-dependent DNA helicase RecG